MIRVLHVLCDRSPGGAERLVIELCRRASSDIEPEILTIYDGGALTIPEGIPVRSAGRRRGRVDAGALGRIVGAMRGFDVVHTHLWAGDVFGIPAATFANIRRVSTAHNEDRDEGRARRRVHGAAWRLAHRVLAVSEAAGVFARELGVSPGRISIVPNGVDLARFRGPWRGGGGLLAIGRLVPQKGFDTLLTAMRHLPGVTLDLVGSGPLEARLRAEAPANVRLLGLRDDVPSLLAAADALVVPSLWEGFGLVAAEGLAAGVPVVASRVGGLPEVLGDAGVLVPPGDPVALAGALEDLLADPGRRAELSAAGRKRSARWDIDRTVRAVEANYR